MFLVLLLLLLVASFIFVVFTLIRRAHLSAFKGRSSEWVRAYLCAFASCFTLFNLWAKESCSDFSLFVIVLLLSLYNIFCVCVRSQWTIILLLLFSLLRFSLSTLSAISACTICKLYTVVDTRSCTKMVKRREATAAYNSLLHLLTFFFQKSQSQMFSTRKMLLFRWHAIGCDF